MVLLYHMFISYGIGDGESRIRVLLLLSVQHPRYSRLIPNLRAACRPKAHGWACAKRDRESENLPRLMAVSGWPGRTTELQIGFLGVPLTTDAAAAATTTAAAVNAPLPAGSGNSPLAPQQGDCR